MPLKDILETVITYTKETERDYHIFVFSSQKLIYIEYPWKTSARVEIRQQKKEKF